ncbi:MAG: Mpo1-like protein [Flavobacteriales bacterium]
MAARTIQHLFDEYGESHRNPTNVAVHWIAVPLIYFSIFGLLYSIPALHLPYWGRPTVVSVVLLAVVLFYLRHSVVLAIGMGLFTVLCVLVAKVLDNEVAWPLWAISIGIFVLAWIAQFIGHGVEGRKPSFLKDLQFLLIGPAWLLAKVYRKMRIPY